ncbi:MAG: 30S ribosomal protein S18 [Planctomycetes bacterium]|nr:30S ribosomal protein S18 [Planctomycetota bacterium]
MSSTSSTSGHGGSHSGGSAGGGGYGGGGYGGGYGGGGRDGGNRRSKFGRFGVRRREVLPEEPLDYKNIAYLAKFVSANGRIQSRKRTGFSGQNQRKLANAIKQARMVGLLPFVGRM